MTDETTPQTPGDAAKVTQDMIAAERAQQMADAINDAVKPIYEKLTAHEAQMQKLATTEYIDKKFEKIEAFVDGFNLTVKVGAVLGRFSMKSVTILVTLIIAAGVISGGFKALVAWMLAWAVVK